MSEQLTAVHSTAAVPTAHARRYLTQLCKHFLHRRPVEFGDAEGTIKFTAGTCTLRADAAALMFSVSAVDAAQLVQVQDVVARHLVRLAFREALEIRWQPAYEVE